MSLNLNAANTQKTDLGRIADGTYPARVVQVIDLGVQHNTVWVNGASQKEYYVVGDDGKTLKGSDGYAKKTTNDTGHPVLTPKIHITFEFPTELIEELDNKPRWQSKEYNVTSAGALKKLVDILSPGSSYIGDVLGKPCLVAIGSTSGGKAKVSTVSAPIAGMDVGELVNSATMFDFDNPDKAVWDGMFNWLQEKIKESTNYQNSALQQMVEGTVNTPPVKLVQPEQPTSEPDGDDPF